MKPSLSFLLLLLAVLWSACGEEEAVRVQLTPEQRDKYQEIASVEIASLRPVLDSLCTATFEDRVAVATDSIVQRRLEEETRLRLRVQQSREQ